MPAHVRRSAGHARRAAIALIALASFWPTLVLGQAPRAGVVTTLEGRVTATRVATPTPIALRFKDDVLLQDRITTAEQSFARLLLGGKAVVSVRERSQFTITEIPGQSIVDLQSGKLAVAVARERLRPGERIELRTPGAIAAVRGTVLIASVGEPGFDGQRRETIYVLRGIADFQVRTAAGGTPPAPVTLGPNQSFTVVGGAATIGAFTDADVSTIAAGLKARGMQHVAPANTVEARQSAQRATVAALGTALLIATGPTIPPIRETLAVTTDTPSDVPLTPLTSPTNPVFKRESEPQPPVVVIPPLPPEPPVTSLILQPGETLKTFTGPSESTQATPIVPVATDVQQLGADQLIDVRPGAAALIAGPLLDVQDSQIVAGASVLHVAGDLTSTSPDSLIAIDPSSVNAPSADFIRIDAGGRLTLTAAPLLTSSSSVLATGASLLLVAGEGSRLDLGAGLFSFLNSTVVTGGDVIRVLDGGSIASTGASPAIQMSGTGLSAAANATLLHASGGSPSAPSAVVLNGPLLAANGSALNLPGGLVAASGVAQISGGKTAGPFVALTGGSHAIATTPGRAMFALSGRDTELVGFCNGDCSPPFGQDEPLRPGSGPLLELTNATVQAQQALQLVDANLVQAVATSLLSIQASGALALGTDAIALSRSGLSTFGPVALVNGGVFTVTNGALVRLDSSFLNVNGDLLHVANGGLVNLLNGPLLSLNGSSLAEVSGALAAFTAGAGNAIRISNNLCAANSCVDVNGVRVAIQGGQPRFTINGVPFRTNPGAQGTVTLSPNGAHVFMQSGSTLRVGPRGEPPQ